MSALRPVGATAPVLDRLGPVPGLHQRSRNGPGEEPTVMARAKPMQVALPEPHPFARAFPGIAAAVSFAGACLNLTAAVLRRVWPWRRELALASVVGGVWYAVGLWLPLWWALAAALAALSAPATSSAVRGRLWGWLRCARTRRLVLAGFAETRAANPSGRLPRIAHLSRTAVGERVALVVRPGQSAELLDARVEELRAAARCREVRITRDPNASHRVLLDVVRRDPLAASADVAWADVDGEVLSMWDPVHLGVGEDGQGLRLSFVERSLLVGGEPGSGKSSLLNVVASHAAKSPDAHLVLIDPNEVQFGPWKDRALAYASDDADDALDVLELVRDEIRRRLTLLKTLPGVVRKVTRDIAAEHDLPLWVLLVDELAFHTSVVGSPKQRADFNTAARDVVARCRAAGIVPLMATQRPTADVVPTSLRDLFSLRCAFRTTTTTSSDVILGDSWARRGFSATDIDITARGVGWLLAEGREPVRMKAAWIGDETIAELSVTTIRHRPNAPARSAGPLIPSPRGDEGRPA
jgi:hypothetical protein